MGSEIEGIVLLDGSTVTIDGITYGGTGVWHDLSYGVSMGFSEPYLYDVWLRTMNDSNLILRVFTHEALQCHFEAELVKHERIFDQIQVIVTHVGPDASNIPIKYQNVPVSTFFYFDGSHLLGEPTRSYGVMVIFTHMPTMITLSTVV